MATSDPVAFTKVGGKPVYTFQEGVEALREEWRKYKAPLIKRQMELGGPKVTDPDPRGDVEAPLPQLNRRGRRGRS